MTTYTLYPDGGVLRKNPSPIGGTWAFVMVTDDGKEHQESGVIPVGHLGLPVITNNQTEMYAMLKGLAFLPKDARNVVVCPDSQVTLERCFGTYTWKNIPHEWHDAYLKIRARQANWADFKTILLAGHPTRAQLATGFGHGYPVSKYNVLADRLCTEAGERYLATL